MFVSSNDPRYIDEIATKDRKIEDLLGQLAIERKERRILEEQYHANLNRVRQSCASSNENAAAVSALESELISVRNEKQYLQRAYEDEREKNICDLEEAIRQRDDALIRTRELESKMSMLDEKARERNVKIIQLKEKYEAIKERHREATSKMKKMELYMTSLPTHNELDAANLKSQQLQEKVVDLEEKVANLQSTVNELLEKRATLENENNLKEAKIAELELESKGLKEELDPLNYLCSKREEITEKPTDVQIQVYQKLLSDAEKECERQKQMVQVCSKQLTIQTRKTEEIRQQMLEKCEKYEDDKRQLRESLEHVEVEKSHLQNDVRNLQTAIQDYLVMIEEQKRQLRNFNSLATGDAGVLHEALIQRLLSCADKCTRLEKALRSLLKAALQNRAVCTAMANSIEITELLSTSVPLLVFEDDLDATSKLHQMLHHSDDIGARLDETNDKVLNIIASVQAEAFPW